jgi:hypothetical protein
LVKKHTAKSKAHKTAKKIEIKVNKIPTVENKPRYIPGSWKGTTQKKVISKTGYKPRYIPGFWKPTAENKPRYIPGSWKGTKQKKISQIRYKPRYIPGFWRPSTKGQEESKPRYIPGSWKGTTQKKISQIRYKPSISLIMETIQSKSPPISGLMERSNREKKLYKSGINKVYSRVRSPFESKPK